MKKGFREKPTKINLKQLVHDFQFFWPHIKVMGVENTYEEVVSSEIWFITTNNVVPERKSKCAEQLKMEEVGVSLTSWESRHYLFSLYITQLSCHHHVCRLFQEKNPNNERPVKCTVVITDDINPPGPGRSLEGHDSSGKIINWCHFPWSLECDWIFSKAPGCSRVVVPWAGNHRWTFGALWLVLPHPVLRLIPQKIQSRRHECWGERTASFRGQRMEKRKLCFQISFSVPGRLRHHRYRKGIMKERRLADRGEGHLCLFWE